jgi:hypothetical protein
VVTEKPLITPEPRYQSIPPLINRENIPRVKIFKGKVKILITGRKNIFTNVRHAPAMRATQIGLTTIPETIIVVAQIATESINQCKIILIK